MTPDALIVLPAGAMPAEGGGLRTTTLEESDAFGTLGGRDRVEAAALLSARHKKSFVVTTAGVYARELQELGVSDARLVEVAGTSNTEAGVAQAVQLAQDRGWKSLAFVSTAYHLPRVETFYKRIGSAIPATFISAEAVLAEKDAAFAAHFARVQKSPEYKKRLAAEARGIEALRGGTYAPAEAKDKRERPARS